MHKELNPNLFLQQQQQMQPQQQQMSQAQFQQQPISSQMVPYDINPAITPPVEAMMNKAVTTSEEVHVLRRQVFRQQEQITKLSHHLLEQNKSQQLKYERTAQAITRMEQGNVSFAQDISEKIAQISSRISERKAVDLKIQDLIEQQNIMLKTNDDRIQKLQKYITEKDIQMNNLVMAMQEAQMEIQRLKRQK